ncbi:MAG: hypothetical protein GXY34_00875 [Syntrophomonadaceae bacterium]|nr:hypothetical protein [Syntrophomonadaceae bacterium]
MMILVAIDDTDNLESRGTGKLAAMLAENIEKKGWGKTGPITRHQLLVHPDIPYTSHNSTMCFTADIYNCSLDSLASWSASFLERECAPGSDPGLCIACIDQVARNQELIDYAYRAKEEVIPKEEAYALARRYGIHLSEHGGSGIGVIGALAGVGLRYSGNDGRFRGKLEIMPPGGVATVQEIKARSLVEKVCSTEGELIPDDEPILLGETQKAVLIDGQAVMLVFPTEATEPERARWQTCTKTYLKRF